MRFSNHFGFRPDSGDGEVVALNQVVATRRCVGNGAGRMVDFVGMQQAFDLAVSAERGAGRAHNAFLRPIQRIQQVDGVGFAFVDGTHHVSQGGHGRADKYRLLRECCDRQLQKFVQGLSAGVIDMGIQGLRTNDQCR